MARKTAKRARVFHGAWMVLAVIALGVVIAIRIRLLGIPLERDEGEYAYAGQLMLQGIPPYQLAYNMKFPGTYAAYAVIMAIFGQTIAGIHLGLLLVNLATITLIFFLGRRLFDSATGLVAAVTYAVLSLSTSVLGLAAHVEHFVMLPILGGTLLLLGPSRNSGSGSAPQTAAVSSPPLFLQLFVSGVLFGIALLMKQPVIWFILFGAIYLLASDRRFGLQWKTIILRNLIFGAGAVLPFAIACLLLWRAGVFDRFWFWTIDYARQYGSLASLGMGFRALALTGPAVIESAWALSTLAGIGLAAGLWHRPTRASTGFVLALFVFSVLAVSAGFYFREHYFILILPAVSLLTGVAIRRFSDLVAARASAIRFAPFVVFCAALAQPILAASKLYFEDSPIEACLVSYGLNPFAESVRIAEYLRDHSSPSDTIAVLGSEPQIYFYSRRHSATGYIYTYALMEPQSRARQMQEEMIREIELARPKYVVSVKISTSWLRRPESESLIFTWANDYIKKYYDVVGLVNILPTGQTDYYLGELPKSRPRLGSYVLICQRKS
jgi:4-amino-4-deoxy-L-arabinose transferase-like glycosyltransferase